MGIRGKRPETATDRELKASRGPGSKYQSDIDLPALTVLPPMPKWMPNEYAKAEWKRGAPIMLKHGLLNEANWTAYAMLCAAFGSLIDGMHRGRKEISATLLSQYRGFCNDFGLTPSSQSRVHSMAPAGGKGSEESGNPFAKNKRSRQANEAQPPLRAVA